MADWFSTVNHSDLPGFFRQRTAAGQGFGLGGYQRLVAFGHKEPALRSVITGSGIRQGQALSDYFANNPIGGSTPAPAQTGTPDIKSLSAYDLNQIQQSLNKYNASQTRPAGGFDSRFERSRFDLAARAAKSARDEFKKGDYGLEDEYRYMLSQGFKPSGRTPQAAQQQQQTAAGQTTQAAQPQQTYTTPKVDSGPDYAAMIAELNRSNQANIASITSGFQTQMKQMADTQAKQIAEMQAAQQKAAAKMAAESAERARALQIQQQTAMANAARAGQTADFRVGTDRGAGGIGAFKRRMKITPVAAEGLSLAAGKKSPNKMLNV